MRISVWKNTFSARRRKLSSMRLYCARSSSSSAAKSFPGSQIQIDEFLILRNVEGDCGEGIDHLLERRSAHSPGIVADLDRDVDDTCKNADTAHARAEPSEFLKRHVGLPSMPADSSQAVTAIISCYTLPKRGLDGLGIYFLLGS